MSVVSDIPGGVGDAPETVRNRVLRRIDWRFLLKPKARKSVCFARGVLAKAVELISESTVDPYSASSGECDLAVAVNPSQATLRLAWLALQPGGCCYTEWYVPWFGRRHRIRRQLENAGFDSVVCYWVWPWPWLSSPRFWVPLDSRGALKHFITARPQPRNPLRRMASRGLRLVWHLGAYLGLLGPVCGIGCKPSCGGSATQAIGQMGHVSQVEPWFFNMVRDRWREWKLDADPGRLSWLLLTGGPRSISKVVGLIFAEPQCRPQIAVKFPRVEESVETLRKEMYVLQALHQSRLHRLTGVPRVLFWHQENDEALLGETALTGVPLLYLLRADNYRDLAFKGAQWLSDLVRGESLSSPAEWWERLVGRTVDRFAATFGPVIDSRMLQATRDALDELGSLPLVCEQRDFSPWNVLLSAEGDVVVLDWESAELHGLPGLDLWYFLTYMAIFLEHAASSRRVRAAYRKLLNQSTFVGSVAYDNIAYYTQQVGMKLDDFRRLRLLIWLIHSRSDYKHFTADAGGHPTVEQLQRSIFLQLWQEEVHAL